MSDVKVIELDGSKWKDALAFLTALRTAICAPNWHEMSPAAFVDSMVWGRINALEPPYTIMVTGLERAPTEVGCYVDLVSRLLAKADDEHSGATGRRVNAKVVRSSP